MASYVYLDDICRLCLNSNIKENTLSLIKITETFQVKFQEVTQQNVNKQTEFLVLMFLLTFAFDLSFR